MSKAAKVKRMSNDRMVQIMLRASERFEGDCGILESALGALVFGREIGWKALRIMHSARTWKRYQEILDVDFREVLEEETAQSERMRGFRWLRKLGKFWQVIVAGLVPAEDRKVMDAGTRTV